MTLKERYEAALLYADQLDEIRAAHALDCAECGYASPALEAAAIRAHDAYVIAERLKAMNLKWGQINDEDELVQGDWRCPTCHVPRNGPVFGPKRGIGAQVSEAGVVTCTNGHESR